MILLFGLPFLNASCLPKGEPGTIKNHALAEMANMLMEEPVFNRLRTEEQLGYTVYCMLRNTFGVLGVSISIYAQVD